MKTGKKPIKEEIIKEPEIIIDPLENVKKELKELIIDFNKRTSIQTNEARVMFSLHNKIFTNQTEHAPECQICVIRVFNKLKKYFSL